jgi:hypothetical protein
MMFAFFHSVSLIRVNGTTESKDVKEGMHGQVSADRQGLSNYRRDRAGSAIRAAEDTTVQAEPTDPSLEIYAGTYDESPWGGESATVLLGGGAGGARNAHNRSDGQPH